MSFLDVTWPKPTRLSYTVKQPLNREPSIETLIREFITTNEQGFDRNHGPIPHLSASDHLLVIDGIVATPLVLNMSELEDSFPQYEVTCALTCAGNRRNTMSRQMRPVRGVGWNDGAVMNCTWSGPLLRDVLLRAGVTSPFSATSSAISNTARAMENEVEESRNSNDVRDSELHVWFSSTSAPTQDEASGFGGSITLSRALDPACEVVLAMNMNGETLPINHGFPLRVVVPGQLGARSVKWLERITISIEESFSHYQRRDYKILPEAIETWEQANGTTLNGDGVGVWPHVPSMTDMPVNSAIGIPATGSTITRGSDGTIEVKGYALPHGEDGPVVRVEVSSDEGKSWVAATIADNNASKWCWCLWNARVKIEKGQNRSIWSRATDKAGNIQQRFPKWNLRGVAYNGFGEAQNLTIS